MSTFELSAYELEDTRLFNVKNARGDDDLLGTDGKPVTIELYSPGSVQGVKALHKSARAAQMRMFRSMRGEFDPQDAANADREQAEKLAAFTKAISDNFPVAPLAVFSNPRLCYWNRQVEEAIAKLGNFSKGPSGA
jgi:hypothetical protein